MALGNVRPREKTRLQDFVSDSSGRVTRVIIQPDEGEPENLGADLVIDASGRASRMPRWLGEQGLGVVPTQELEISMGYTTGIFRPPPGGHDEDRACLMLAIPPATRAAYLTPVDGGVWIATMYGRGGDNAPKDLEGFLEWTRGLAHPVIGDWLRRAEFTGEMYTYGIRTAVWRRYDQMERFPDGLLPIGEGFTSFTPMIGQGISLAAGQALALGASLRDQATNGDALAGLARPYFERCHALNATGWGFMETLDFAYPGAKGQRPDDLEQRWRINRAIRALAQRDPEVHQLMARVTHLLEPPSVLRAPEILERAMREDRAG